MVETYHDNKGLKLWEPFGVDILAKFMNLNLFLVNLSGQVVCLLEGTFRARPLSVVKSEIPPQ